MMRPGSVIAVLLVLSFLAAAPVLADDRDAGDLREFWSVNGGIAYAWNDHAFQDFNGNDVATYLSGGWGGSFDFLPAWMGMEVEAGLTVTDGRWMGEDWSMYSVAAYPISIYIGSPQLYLKGRGGLSSNRVKIDEFTGSDTGLAGGVGIGFLLLDQPLELHFTAVDGNVNTFTLHWRF